MRELEGLRSFFFFEAFISILEVRACVYLSCLPYLFGNYREKNNNFGIVGFLINIIFVKNFYLL